MKKVVLASVTVIGMLLACNKDKFQTKPRIVVKSVDPSNVPIQGSTLVTLEFFDKEGDVDSVVTMKRSRLNRDVRPLLSNLDSFDFRIPQFPDKSQGEIEIRLEADRHLKMARTLRPIPGTTPQQYEPDTVLFKFVLKDKAKNVSDTVSTTIVVQRRP